MVNRDNKLTGKFTVEYAITKTVSIAVLLCTGGEDTSAF